MDKLISDAVEELTPAENRDFVNDYLLWADSLPSCTLQLDRPLVILQRDGVQVGTLHLETALLTVFKWEGE